MYIIKSTSIPETQLCFGAWVFIRSGLTQYRFSHSHWLYQIVTQAVSCQTKCTLGLMRRRVELPGVPLILPHKPIEPVRGPPCVIKGIPIGDNPIQRVRVCKSVQCQVGPYHPEPFV